MAAQFDVVVIGAGPGGYVAAIRAAQLGPEAPASTGVPRWAALSQYRLHPSKALLDSSELFVQARSHLGQHGIKVGDVQLDLPAHDGPWTTSSSYAGR